MTFKENPTRRQFCGSNGYNCKTADHPNRRKRKGRRYLNIRNRLPKRQTKPIEPEENIFEEE